MWEMVAPGAIAWIDSTSSVSSPYQPTSIVSSGGKIVCVIVVDCRWRRADHVSRSDWIVGDANASMIATVSPAPLLPVAIAWVMPYAPRVCFGDSPHGTYGWYWL